MYPSQCVCVYVCEHWPWLEIGLPANVVVYIQCVKICQCYMYSSDDGLIEVGVPVCPTLTPMVDHLLAD